MSENEEFLRFCGQLVFGDGVDAWKRLTESQREAYCAEAQKTGWDLLFFSCLKEHLPEPYRRDFKKRHQLETIKRLMEERDLADLYRFLETQEIPFIPIKGADLAFRLYSDPALRSHSDWDVLFRKEDCPKVIRLLHERGWKTLSGSIPDKPLHHQYEEHHHYEAMSDGRHWIEVHHTLPNFGKATAAEIWQQTMEVSNFHRALTPEMNLLLLSAHTGEDPCYARVSIQKMLLDAMMILKRCTVDWDLVHHLADRWGILKPDALFHVWGDMFPKGILPEEDPNSEQQELIRGIFKTRDVVLRHSRYERQMVAEKRDIRWLKRKLLFYNKEAICEKYHLAGNQTGRILVYGVRDFIGKVLFFLTHFKNENPDLRTYCQKVSDLKKSICRHVQTPAPRTVRANGRRTK